MQLHHILPPYTCNLSAFIFTYTMIKNIGREMLHLMVHVNKIESHALSQERQDTEGRF